ncbi:MAG: 5-formyltetrahydrofolate cyclo-ligase [Clostridia bacterium]|nr:5-formyltetrahydrofolate cyclo-ligase [Clostridia bacterium]
MNSLKEKIRIEMMEKRSLLRLEEVEESSVKVSQKLMNLARFKECAIIMSYVDFRNEIITMNLIQNCLENGKRVCVPKVFRDHGVKEMIASEILNLEEDLEKGSFGILEPKRGSIRWIDPKGIDFMVIPGLAFDTRKNRLGYGAGYYDRFFKTVRKDCFKVGIGFEFQVLNTVPVEEHDVPMDLIITESTIF